MKIIKIIGGLGNQMFQYALFLALKEKYPEEIIKLDCSYFKTYHVHTGLELHRVFGVELPQASFIELLRVTWPVYSFKLSRMIRKVFPPRSTECLEAKDYTYNEQVFSEGDKYYDGYWQNFLYFDSYRDVIKSAFDFQIPLNVKSASLYQSLQESNSSISIHVRRGDYLKANIYIGLCGLKYYEAAIGYMKKHVTNPVFYVFSDDMDWCRRYLSPLTGEDSICYVDWNKDKDAPLDLLLMSKCKYNIIANSSFSWWAAYLNDNIDKIVCAPQKWINMKMNCRVQMSDWILF